ncbi:MAG: helix-turn-helix domain-containing protein [Prolixibacteraceae bacterium]|nr:helix-turn-helix domain-containing protein [Prolixibacteraceae bacterium]
MSISYILRALLYLAPSIFILNVNLEWSVWITGPIKVLLIPLNYLYVRKLFEADKSIRLRDLWHFIPFVLDCILTFVVAANHASEVVNYNHLDVKKALDTVWEGNFYYTLLSTIARTISFLQWTVYSVFTIPLIKKCIAYQKESESQINYQYVVWLKGIVVLFVIMGLFEGLTIFGVYNYPPVFILMWLFLIIYAFYFFIFAILFSEEKNRYVIEWEHDSARIVFNPELEIIDEHLWLQKFLELDLYLDPELTLQKASTVLRIPKYKLSQLIRNDGYSNFYSFVNLFRVEKSKSLLRKLPDSHVVESIAKESGFKSRSTYFRVFKEFVGETPGEFLKSCQTHYK